RCSTDGRPSRSSPPPTTRPHPHRPIAGGTANWVATVDPSSTKLTRPAPALSDPASTTHRGATGRSTAYPEKPVNATTARATIPGTDQMEAGAAGPSGTGTWLERGPVTRAR